MTATSLQNLLQDWSCQPRAAPSLGQPGLSARLVRASMPNKKISQPSASPKTGPRIRPVPAVSRSVAILRVLSQAKEPMKAQAIAGRLGIVPSTCLHILRALTAERLLSFDPATKRYKLGIGMLALARAAKDNDPFVQTVQPILDQVSQHWGVTAIGVEVMDLEQMIVAALSHSRLPFRLHVDVGSRFPALISATGRLVAAFGNYPEDVLRSAFDSLRWQKPVAFADWKNQVAQAREQGYALDVGNYIAGIALIAVPVLDALQHITHTLVVACIADQLPEARREELVRELLVHAGNLSNELYAFE